MMTDQHHDRATVDILHLRLQAWATWLTSGGNAAGYPSKNVLHQSWLPPAPGSTPSMRTTHAHSDARERAMHVAVACLSIKLQNAVVAAYVMRAGPAAQAQLQQCKPSTARARLMAAHAKLAASLRA